MPIEVVFYMDLKRKFEETHIIHLSQNQNQIYFQKERYEHSEYNNKEQKIHKLTNECLKNRKINYNIKRIRNEV